MLPKVMFGDVELSLTVIKCCDTTFKEVPVAKTIMHCCKLTIRGAGAAKGEHRNFSAVAKVAVD
jgi:hypothetical protein